VIDTACSPALLITRQRHWFLPRHMHIYNSSCFLQGFSSSTAADQIRSVADWVSRVFTHSLTGRNWPSPASYLQFKTDSALLWPAGPAQRGWDWRCELCCCVLASRAARLCLCASCCAFLHVYIQVICMWNKHLVPLDPSLSPIQFVVLSSLCLRYALLGFCAFRFVLH
jgi:hypothetical protein